MSRSPDSEGHRSPSRSASNHEAADPKQLERGIFVGGTDHDLDPKELEDLFNEFGEVQFVDVKNEFSFVFMASGGDDAVRSLDRTMFKNRTIKVEWARGDGRVKRREHGRQADADRKPNKTLFVVNFGRDTSESKLTEVFCGFGPLTRVHIRNNFAFVEFEELDDAVRAKEKMNGTPFGPRTLTVEYQADRVGRRDDDRRGYGGGGFAYRGGGAVAGGGYDRMYREPRYERYDERRFEERYYDERRYDERRDDRRFMRSRSPRRERYRSRSPRYDRYDDRRR